MRGPIPYSEGEMGIRNRIVLPFLALFAIVFVTTALIATFLIARSVEERLDAQAGRLAELIDRQQMILQFRHYLDALREHEGALGIRVGNVTIGTVPENPSGPGVFRSVTKHGELVVAYSPDLISQEKARAVRPFAILATGGLLLVLVLGYLTAQAVARPLEELAVQARALPAGEVKPVGGGAELDHLVEAMNRMLAEVRRKERLAVMGQMAAGVAHEVRNPLSAMKMTVQMLRSGGQDPEALEVLLREIERLELTAAELVSVSQPLRKERVRLDRVVDEVLELMRRQLEHLAIRVERRFDPAPEVEIDVARFKRCVMNLVLNGAQAMPSGGPLKLEIAPRDGRVRLAVTDAGGGVPAAVRGRVFEPFVTTKQDGVGLGLALTRRIVEDHGGAIGFEDAAAGATFWIELPHG